MSGSERSEGRHLRAAYLMILCATLLAVFMVQSTAFAADAPLTPEGEPICVTCHQGVSEDIVRTWRSQNHGQAGVGCDRCHNTHEEDFRPQPAVSVCQGCHDVPAIHGTGFAPSSPAEQCMDCHTANVHLLAGPESWFQGGLPREDLAGETESKGISARTATVTAVFAVVAAVLVGLGVGWLFNRFAREL